MTAIRSLLGKEMAMEKTIFRPSEFGKNFAVCGPRLRAFVMALLAWTILLVSWDLAARLDDELAYTQPAYAASILARLSNSSEIEYESMHEGGGDGALCCVFCHCLHDRQSIYAGKTN